MHTLTLTLCDFQKFRQIISPQSPMSLHGENMNMYVLGGSRFILRGCKPRSGSVRSYCAQKALDRCFRSKLVSPTLVVFVLLFSWFMRLSLQVYSSTQVSKGIFIPHPFSSRLLHAFQSILAGSRMSSASPVLFRRVQGLWVRRIRLTCSTPATWYPNRRPKQRHLL